ncbi:MAG: ABC transporter ATP-binding protein [Reyranella sp.]|uniref:ABC transporter ATP-binding protein n=1 Tax=Reyranella sp. TaxID=1929291 RepID=UPI0025E9D9C5|nr:ABC transporter ATP-binding protein [Reyranella sp.]MBR2819921.1 ABC transporter ATP-binding protein [Reyranella sp.]
MTEARRPGAEPAGTEPVLVCDGISRWFGGVRALADVSISINRGEICGLVGPNGSGKTTIVNAVTGFYPPQKGRILFEGTSLVGLKPHRIAKLRIARTFQNLALFRGMSVLDNIMMGRHIHMQPSALATFFYWAWAERDELRQRELVEDTIDFLQLQDVRDAPIEVVPLGLQKRIELARALVAEPRLLILDEPMAGMNQEEKEYMARFILDAREERGLTVLLIEHHMDVVAALCDRVTVLSYGEKLAEGAPIEALSDPKVVAAYLGSKKRHAA